MTTDTSERGLERGITVVHIYASELEYMTVALPPLVEQATIV